ncbi:hypothetical protein BUALT_Bualt16G0129800 [Buddleja alternifolia]|uniref:DUF2470 domain-containing protein n=1 Tax=Buddleja alternifolia TaxID=168488 RepID=A0AAV6WHR0_9LAMI|nr:hypothetical protein BUALT_Bualt16G0129800 [Buddleja alternifolia]
MRKTAVWKEKKTCSRVMGFLPDKDLYMHIHALAGVVGHLCLLRCFKTRPFNSISSSSLFNGGNNSSNHHLFLSPSSSPFKSPFPLIRRRRLASLSPDTQNADANAQLNVFQLIQAHQEKAARLPPIEEIRTLLHHSLRGVLSTFSLVHRPLLTLHNDFLLFLALSVRYGNGVLLGLCAIALSQPPQKYEGYPSGSMVDFASDAHGSPLLAVSSLAVHSKDLLANPKCSLLVAKDPEDRTDLVIIVHGDAIPVSQTDREAIRSAYLARHPDAFWVDFGDFRFLRIEPKVVRYVSGVATALLGSGEFSKDEFAAAKVDPIYQYSKPITSHMNKDHAEDTKLIVQHSTSVPVEFAYMLDMDSLGFNVKAGYEGNTFKLRIPFTRRAADRKYKAGTDGGGYAFAVLSIKVVNH